MEEQIIPIVPGNGKYGGKPVTEMMADESYVENVLKKNSTWFNPNNKNWAPIYNIIVNQSISTNKDGKTPEHNKFQNLFLVKSIQQKLLSKIFPGSIDKDKLSALFSDENFIRCFGENKMPEFINNVDKTDIQFEYKFNWDLFWRYLDSQSINIISNLETEISDKINYKQQYDIEEKEKYENNLLLIYKLIEGRIKLDEKAINIYEEKMNDYRDKSQKYENNIKIYLEQKQQNEKDVANYKNKIKIYETKRDKFITQQKKQICQELGINYEKFEDWNSYRDMDTTHTSQEKQQLREIIDDKLEPFIKDFERINTKPNYVEKLNMPTKPSLPEKYNLEKDIYILKNDDMYETFEKCSKIIYLHNLCSLDKLNKYKKNYENKYKKDYENNFIEHYEEYRLLYYRDIIKKYCNKNIYVCKKNENQYEISIDICDYDYSVCCELKTILSDDYPCVLRKMKAQIELSKNDKTAFGHRYNIYLLIIEKFKSNYVSKEQLITIFNQSNIKVIFSDEIFEASNPLEITCENTNIKQILSENKLMEENKFLTDNLLQTQQKLLQAEEKIKQLEEKIRSFKTQKQCKSIKEYFKNE